MSETKHIAIDFGASSGRVILGTFDGHKVLLEEVYRFANTPVEMNGVLYWDFPKLFQEIKNGLKAVSRITTAVESLAIDTWGVDFGYIDQHGHLLLLPKNYRNETKLKYQEAIYDCLSEFEFYEETGVLPSSINSYVQLYADLQEHPWLKETVAHVLFMPDLFNYFLTEQTNVNYAIASTSGLLSTEQKWSTKVLDTLGIPEHWFQQSDMTLHTILGSLTPTLVKETGLKDLQVIASAGHDTAASILTVASDAIFISCGTWSVIGIQLEQPIISKAAYKSCLTNEGTSDGYIKCLKNLNALWVLQRYWSEQGHQYSYNELVKSAVTCKIDSYIDVEDPIFLKHENMYELIRQHLIETGQRIPNHVGEWVRVVIQSIALNYQQTISAIEKLSGRHYDRVHMVGGGIQNRLLCQLTADLTNKEVVTGPVEASAMGNILSQLLTLKLIEKSEIQQVINASVELNSYVPNE
ncbi:rhamnulokinase [Staphylococcus intermedius]|uniref:Putative xylulokinase n=1 Tax=Staphylococcus intermedius NCTC 11048 TaxID=1141106 RepID=A0A380G734_STAIN|nr:rhamnulokinase family protein [Staphylococcus intermedius]PNZ51116.1 rhamnulokinase [Staphylococcus intermedius NCTC 11048]SUM45801.1 putative xylulokinase [Staphylococcus intermedius NCTC 11048]